MDCEEVFDSIIERFKEVEKDCFVSINVDTTREVIQTKYLTAVVEEMKRTWVASQN